MTNTAGYQLNFIKSVQSHSSACPEFCSLFTDDSMRRIQLYQRSFLARVVGNLADTMFEQVGVVFGKEVLRAVLARYFLAGPPSELLITESVSRLSAFVRKSGIGSYHELFAALVEISIGAWELVHGPDPISAGDVQDSHLDSSYLQNNALLFSPVEGIDLYASWIATKSESVGPEQCFTDDPAGLFLVKTGSVTATTIRVPSGVVPIAKALLAGDSVYDSVANLDCDLAHSISDKELQIFIESLQKEGCFVNHSQKKGAQ